MGAFPAPDPRYGEVLAARGVPREHWRNYHTWVRFQLHFCQKYRYRPDDSKSLPLFIEELGCVDELLDHDPQRHDVTKGQACLAQFLVAGRNPTELCALIAEASHLLTSLIGLGIVADGRLAMPRQGHDRYQLSSLKLLANRLTVGPRIPHHLRQLGHGRALVADSIEDRRLVTGAAAQLKRNTGPLVQTAGVNCGGNPTPRAAQSLRRWSAGFFRAPAAYCCGRTLVLSMKRGWAR